MPLRGLSGGHLTGLYGELERDGLAVGTRRLTHAVLRRALNDAVRWGKLARSPATAADPRAETRSRLQSRTARELRRFLAHVEGDRLAALWRPAATTGMRRRELVFCDELAAPIHPRRLTERFARLRKAAGIPTGSLHILRHTSATLALTANPPVPLHVVAGRLGDRPQMLLNTYAHLLPHSDAMAAETVAAVLVDKPLTNQPVTA